MGSFKELTEKRRSIRKYTEQAIAPEDVQLLLQAGLVSPTSKNKKPCHFIAVENKEQLELLSKCKKGGCSFIADSALSIVVAADPLVSDVWIEDASIAATFIQLQAEDLNLGSCWVQVRGRQTSDGFDSEEYVRSVISAPMPLQVLAIIAIGHKKEEKSPQDIEALGWENVHIDKF
ncbi:MAG: putative nitroreductase family protein [Bacteroidetes bacterium]|nr:putative nitroreductase family protein [Bacteroidota bacterium]